MTRLSMNTSILYVRVDIAKDSFLAILKNYSLPNTAPGRHRLVKHEDFHQRKFGLILKKHHHLTHREFPPGKLALNYIECTLGLR